MIYKFIKQSQISDILTQHLTKNSYMLSYIRQGSVATTPQPLRIHEQ